MQMVYFVKDTNRFITPSNIEDVVHFGMLHEKLGNTECPRQDSSMDGKVHMATKAAVTCAKPAIATSMEPLLRLMSSLYLPQVVNSGSWPDTVRKEFLAYTHR
jgi:hypothetical protein